MPTAAQPRTKNKTATVYWFTLFYGDMSAILFRLSFRWELSSPGCVSISKFGDCGPATLMADFCVVDRRSRSHAQLSVHTGATEDDKQHTVAL